MKNQQKISKNIFTNPIFLLPFILVCVAFAGFLIGCFADWQISVNLAGHWSDASTWYSKNGGVTTTWAWYVSGLPGIIACLTLGFTSVLLLASTFFILKDKWSLTYRILMLVAGAIVLFPLLTWWAYDSFINQLYEAYIDPAKWASDATYNSPTDFYKYAYAAIVAVLEIVLFGTLFLVPLTSKWIRNNPTPIIKCALFAVLLVILSQLLVLELKTYYPRARFFQIAITYSPTQPLAPANGTTAYDHDGFKPVYSLFWDANTTPVGSYALGKQSSWPSGHTTWAMMALGWIPFIGLINTKNEKVNLGLKFGFSSFIVVFVMLIMLARVAAGRHYLSDVSTAVLTSSLLILLIALPTFKLIPTEQKVNLGLYIAGVAIVVVIMLFILISKARPA